VLSLLEALHLIPQVPALADEHGVYEQQQPPPVVPVQQLAVSTHP
jgi:hypothetical protein